MPRAKDDDDLPGGEEPATRRKAAKTPAKAAPQAAEETDPELAALEGQAPAKPVHSARLLALAGRCKIPQHEIDSLTSEELMAEVQFEMSRIQDDMARKSADPPPAAPASAKQELTPEDEIDQLVKDGAITEQVARIMRAPFKENKALKEKVAKLDELEARETERVHKSLDDAVNAAFTELGERYAKFYGVGDLSDLKEGSDEWNRRVKDFKQSGITATDSARIIKKKIAAIAKLTYGDGAEPATATPEPAKPAGIAGAAAKPAKKTRDQEFAEGALARPSNRNGSPEPKGLQAAKEAVAKSMRDRGIDPGYVSMSGEDDDLPGGPD